MKNNKMSRIILMVSFSAILTLALVTGWSLTGAGAALDLPTGSALPFLF